MKKEDNNLDYSELEKGLNKTQHILLRTQKKKYSQDCLNTLTFLTKNDFSIILISFGIFNESTLDTLKQQGANLQKIHFIHNNASDSFSDIEISVNNELNKISGKKIVVLMHLHNLTNHKNPNEIGMFFGNLINKVGSAKIPIISLLHTSEDFTLIQTFSSNANKILSLRKEPVTK